MGDVPNLLRKGERYSLLSYESKRLLIIIMANRGNTPWNKGIKTGLVPVNSLNLDEDELYNMYIIQGLSPNQIGSLLGCSGITVKNWLRKYNIPMRNIGDAGYDMSTWFKRDPLKLQTAIDNNIKLLLIYPKHNNYLVSNGHMTTVDISDINKI